MNSFLTNIEPVAGFFPITALIVAGCLWGIFRLTIGMKCHPRLSQHFILMGLCTVTLVSFISPGTSRGQMDEEPYIVAQMPDEHVGATVTVNNLGVAHLNHFRPDCKVYGVRSSASSPEPNLWKSVRTSIYTFFLDSDIRNIYHVGIVVVMLYLLLQVYRLETIRSHSHPEGKTNGIDLYSTFYDLPFSYGKYIFLPYDQPDENRNYVLLHEESHVRHRHFYKLCLLLAIAAFNWYNPFVWLLLAENKILQEMEADEDVMEQGIVPTEYQLNLVRMAVQNKEWIWIKSGYNHHPLKKRILFMNDSINLKQSRIITWLTSLVFLSATILITGGCAETVRSSIEADFYDDEEDDESGRNALTGCWHLKGTARDTSCTKIYPSQTDSYKFYGNGITLTMIIYKNEYNGINVHFNASGRQYKILTDSTMTENDMPFAYRLKTADQLVLTAGHAQEEKSASGMPSELWIREEHMPESIRKILESAVNRGHSGHPFVGTWKLVQCTNESTQQTTPAQPNIYKVYGDDTYFMFYSVQVTSAILDYSFEGRCGTFKYYSDDRISERGNVVSIEWIDQDNYYLTYFDGTAFLKEKWTRSPLLKGYKQILKGIAPALQH